MRSNRVLTDVAADAIAAVGIPAGGDRRSSPAAAARSCAELATQDGVVDLIIPRGGEGLKNALKEHRDRPGHLRGLGQLPRLRRRDAPTSTTR